MGKKSTFIAELIMALQEIGSFTSGVLRRESFSRLNLRVGDYDPDKIYKNLKNLQNRGIIRSFGGNYRFTDSGKKWLSSSYRKYFGVKYSGKWDNKWRIVIFDVPEELSMSRVKFRRKLRQLGFYMIQKSVFVFPYPCEQELADICKGLKIAGYVDIIIAETPGYKEEDIKKFYGL